MLKLRTKTEFYVPYLREQISVIVRMIITDIQFDINNSIVSGYYYYYNIDNTAVKLDDFRFLVPWAQINLIENNMLSPITSPNLFDIVMQRLTEFTFIQLQAENGKNYGTNSADWEVDL